MLKKLMVRFGVGAAKVNLVLEKEQYRIGEAVTGKVVVEGGTVDQEIHTLEVDVVLKVNIRGKEFTRVVETLPVARDFRIEAGETREIPFQHPITMQYPVSKGSVAYSLVTKMDIAQAKDAGDADRFAVLPGREMSLVFSALQILGFKEKISSGKVGQYGQEFEFYPSEQFFEQLREVKLKFHTQGDELKLFLELLLAGGVKSVTHHAELALPSEMLSNDHEQPLADTIKEFLEGQLRQVSLQGPRMAPSYQGYPGAAPGSPFGGFMGGMVAGMLGGAVLGELFGGDENEEAGAEAEGDEGFDLGFGDMMDFGDDEF